MRATNTVSTARSFLVWVAMSMTLLLVGLAAAQESSEVGFSNASMNGQYAFVAGLGAGPDSASPHSVLWLVVRYNGDGTADILTLGRNLPGEEGTAEAAGRAASLNRPDPPPSITYEMSPDGTFLVMHASGDVLWDGLILRSETIGGVPVATEYILFHRQPDPGTGGLAVGRGFLQGSR